VSSTKDITDRARFLRNASPQAFDQFINAFAQYTATVTDGLVLTTVDLQVVQGQAQQCRKILQALVEARDHG
jgi:hypothetical protein